MKIICAEMVEKDDQSRNFYVMWQQLEPPTNPYDPNNYTSVLIYCSIPNDTIPVRVPLPAIAYVDDQGLIPGDVLSVAILPISGEDNTDVSAMSDSQKVPYWDLAANNKYIGRR